MKCRNQRRPLPAEGHIATTEITHHRHAGFCHNLVVIANLHRVRRLADRFMPDGLPMAAYCHDILRVESFLLHQGQYRISKQRPQTHIQLAQLGKRQLLPLADVQDLFF